MRHSSLRGLKIGVALVTMVAVLHAAWASAPTGRYTVGSCGGNSIYDTRTKLQWQRYPANNPPASWSTATDFCRSVRTDAFTWRTPTVKELETLIDYSAFADGGYNVAVDRRWFSQSATTVWSGTPDASGKLTVPQAGGPAVPSAYAVDFSTGQVVLGTMDQSFGVWCVSDNPLQDNC